MVWPNCFKISIKLILSSCIVWGIGTTRYILKRAISTTSDLLRLLDYRLTIIWLTQGKKLQRDMPSDPPGSETFQVDVQRRKPHIFLPHVFHPCRSKAPRPSHSRLRLLYVIPNINVSTYFCFSSLRTSAVLFSPACHSHNFFFDPAGNRPIRKTWRFYFCLNLSYK